VSAGRKGRPEAASGISYRPQKVNMARKRDKLIFEPMYKPRPAEAKPAKRKRPWRTVLQIVTLGLVGGECRGEVKTKRQEQ
jgi:hypothetical protein